MAYVTLGCRCLVAVVFVVSAFSKLRSRSAYHAFAAWLVGLPLASQRVRKAAVPFIAAAEAAIVILLALPWTMRAGFLAAALALAAFAVGTFLAVRRGASEPCQCFGASVVPLGTRHAARNALLCVVAATGAASSAQGWPPEPGWAALSVTVGVVGAVFAVFLDDIAAVFGDQVGAVDAGPRLARSGNDR